MYYWLFQIGALAGLIGKYASAIKNIFSLINVIKTVKSMGKIFGAWWVKYAIVAIIVASITATIWIQHKKIESLKQSVDSVNQELEIEKERVESFRLALEQQNELVSQLEDDKEKLKESFERVRNRLDYILGTTIPNIKTEEDLNKAKKDIQFTLDNSYRCIMQASGREDVQCESY